MNCCSDRAITFHGLSPSKMYLMEYILYHLSVFRNSLKGIGNHPPQSDVKFNNNDIIKAKSKHRVGEPFVQLLNKDSSKENKSLKKPQKTIVENIWEEIFGS